MIESGAKACPELLNVVNLVNSCNPEVGHVSLEAQKTIVTVNFDPPNGDKCGFRTVRFEIFSKVVLISDGGKVEFCNPIENWEQSVPNKVFRMEADGISEIRIDDEFLEVETQNVTLRTQHSDPLYTEAVHIFVGSDKSPFIL